METLPDWLVELLVAAEQNCETDWLLGCYAPPEVREQIDAVIRERRAAEPPSNTDSPMSQLIKSIWGTEVTAFARRTSFRPGAEP